MNPLSVIGGFSLQTKALLIAGLAITCFATGWQVHGWRTKAQQGLSLGKQLKTSAKISKSTQITAKQAQIAVAVASANKDSFF